MARRSSSRLRELGAAPGGSSPLRRDLEPEPPVDLAVFLMFSLVGLVLIIGLASFFGARAVERNLTTRATAALEAAGIEDVAVEADGLDLTLRGTVPADELLPVVVPTVEALEGVRRVDGTRVEVHIPPTPAEIEFLPDPWSITWNGSEVVITGGMSGSGTLDRLTAVLPRGASVDVSGVVFDDRFDLEDPWIEHVAALLDLMMSVLDAGEVTVNPAAGVVLFGGEAPDRQTRRDLRAAAEAALAESGLEAVSGLTVEAAPPPPPRQQVVELQESLNDLIAGKVVEFEVSSDVITPEGQALLDEIFAALQKFPDVPVEIAGHADAQGDAAANLELSERRARAVLEYLVAKGADPARFVVVGYGETRPIADNSTEEGRKQNRRIEFIALEE